MSNDGTGLREAELDARTIYDIACIRADASKATREDVEFKAIALRNYKAIAALSAVAPPAVLEGMDGWALMTFDGLPIACHPGIRERVECAMLQEALQDIADAEAAASPAAPAQPEGGEAVDAMVNRFLCWKLPKDFHPDAGISFTPTYFQKGEEADLHWPVGTNLLTADQARAMFEHCTRPAPAQQAVTQICRECGAPTMHIGDLCFSCSKARKTPPVSNAAASAADAQEGK